MKIDWKQLISVRERQQTIAQEAVARDRRIEEAAAALMQQAYVGWEEKVAAKQAHWQSMTGAMGAGGCTVDQLRSAGSWSSALNGQIAKALIELQQAQARHQEKRAVLEKSRALLRAAAAELQKAQEMQKRDHRETMHQREVRMDESAEESATQIWSAQRLSERNRV